MYRNVGTIKYLNSVYRLALMHAQRSVQWVPGALSRNVNLPNREVGYSPPNV